MLLNELRSFAGKNISVELSSGVTLYGKLKITDDVLSISRQRFNASDIKSVSFIKPF